MSFERNTHMKFAALAVLALITFPAMTLAGGGHGHGGYHGHYDRGHRYSHGGHGHYYGGLGYYGGGYGNGFSIGLGFVGSNYAVGLGYSDFGTPYYGGTYYNGGGYYAPTYAAPSYVEPTYVAPRYIETPVETQTMWCGGNGYYSSTYWPTDSTNRRTPVAYQYGNGSR
jgi:hypothetical protein